MIAEKKATKKILPKTVKLKPKKAKGEPLTEEQLKALPMWRQRVTIAKDVIAMLESSKIRSMRGDYFAFIDSDSDDGFFKEHELIQTVLRNSWKNSASPSCVVCAIGALFVSCVDKFNTLSTEDLDYHYPREDDMIGYLKRWFSEAQLRLIETAFECRVVRNIGENDATSFKATVFASRYVCGNSFNLMPEEAMISIMKNIVRHRGKFVP